MYKILLFLLLPISLYIFSCEKDTGKNNQEKILGTWISTDENDTLNFTDKVSFYKNGDHFDYHLESDSIEVRYSGPLYILVVPTKHKYFLDENDLMIDFSNRNCFGFNREVMHFNKQW